MSIIISPTRQAQEGDKLFKFGGPRGVEEPLGEVVTVDKEARKIIVRGEDKEVFELAFSHRSRSLHVKRARRPGEVLEWERPLMDEHKQREGHDPYACAICEDPQRALDALG